MKSFLEWDYSSKCSPAVVSFISRKQFNWMAWQESSNALRWPSVKYDGTYSKGYRTQY